MGFTMLLRINIVAPLVLITILLALCAQLSSANYLSAGSGHKKLLVQKSSASHSIVLACQASQYPDLCKSSLQANSNISENAGAEEIIGAAMVLSSDETTQSYLHSKQLLTTSDNGNFTGAVKDCLEFLEGSIRYIAKSRTQQLNPRSIKDVKIWMSAALSHQYDCSSALKYVNTTQMVGRSMQELVTVMNFTSNALSMVDALDTYGKDMVIWRPPKTERSSKLSSTADYSHHYNKIWDVLEVDDLVSDVTVSKDESSMSIQQAVNSAPDNSERRFVIRIKAGVYEEIVRIPPTKTNLMFVGDGMDRTVITGSMRVPSLPGVPSTYDSATVAVNADGFLARDIAFENAAGPVSQQAVALRVDSDLSAFYNCALLGHQDTLYTHTLRQFYRNCRIEGTVDFIFGNSAAIFENCLILVRPRQVNASKGSSDAVTAHGRTDPAQPTGFVFHNCTINGTEEYMKEYYSNPKIYKAYLGRPWKMYSRVIFMNSYLGEIISPEGWMPWTGDFALDTLYYGEYQNYGPGAKVSGRVPWSNQIPEINAGMYSINSFIQGDEWLPATIN
jgi:pectinesterase inhibitor-like protein